MKKCKHCGEKFPDVSKRCMECGKHEEEEKEVQNEDQRPN